MDPLSYPKRIAEEIKSLRIQGAKNIAMAALDAVQYVIRKAPARNVEELKEFVEKAVAILVRARPTEPQLRDAMAFTLWKLSELEENKLETARRQLYEELIGYETYSNMVVKKIAEIGARKIPEEAIVITHCHSSTVMEILRKAKEMGKKITLYVTETRPRNQGLITAKEARDMGIRTVFFVDSAAYYYMKDADIYLTGADAITSDGFIVNKIGTALIAVAAEYFGVPFYVAASTLKYDPLTAEGFPEIIEMRDPQEVAEIPGVEVRNPAFDLTPPNLVEGVITEFGIFPPQTVPFIAMQKRKFLDRYSHLLSFLNLLREG